MSTDQTQTVPENTDLDRRVDSGTMGVFLLLLGTGLLLGIGWGAGLIGVGIILLVEQAVRRHLAVNFDWFWVGVGLVSVFCGISMLLGANFSLVPIIIMVIGVSLIASAAKGKQKAEKNNDA